jgi:hypothetical protein
LKVKMQTQGIAPDEAEALAEAGLQAILTAFASSGDKAGSHTCKFSHNAGAGAVGELKININERSEEHPKGNFQDKEANAYTWSQETGTALAEVLEAGADVINSGACGIFHHPTVPGVGVVIIYNDKLSFSAFTNGCAVEKAGIQATRSASAAGAIGVAANHHPGGNGRTPDNATTCGAGVGILFGELESLGQVGRFGSTGGVKRKKPTREGPVQSGGYMAAAKRLRCKEPGSSHCI